MLAGCSSYKTDQLKKAKAIADDGQRTDVVAIGEIAKVCFVGTGNPRGGKLASGGYGIAVTYRDLGLTSATSIESQQAMTRRAIAWRLLCVFKNARARHLEEVVLAHLLPVGEKQQPVEVYRVKATLAGFDGLEGWESLDVDDLDDMNTLWKRVEVLKEDWEGLSIQ